MSINDIERFIQINNNFQTVLPKLKKELIQEIDNTSSKSNIINKKNSIGIGFGTNKSVNAIQYTYDIKLSRNTALFGLLGSKNILLGFGLTWQSNYNENGWMIGFCSGGDERKNLLGSFSLSYQWQLGNKPNFLSIGWSGYYSITIIDYEHNSDGWPILSFDRRF